MQEEKLKKIVPVLAVILVIIFISKTGILTKKSKPSSKFQDIPESSFQKSIFSDKKISETVATKTEDSVDKVSMSKLSWAKNIFSPLVKKTYTRGEVTEEISGTTIDDFEFTGWAQKEEDVIAIISDNLVRLGDELADREVILIDKDKVVLQDKDGGNYIVTYATDETSDEEGFYEEE